MPKSRGITGALIILFAITVTASLGVLSGRVQGSKSSNRATSRPKDREGSDFRNRFPVVDYEAETQVGEQEREERKNKSRRYDRSGLVRKDSSTEIEETVREVRGQGVIEAIPVGQSTAVIIGEVRASEAHLSNDKSGVYTEVLVRVVEVLKSDGSTGLAASNAVSADRPGGIVRYRDGRQRLYRIFGLNMPQVSGRYVLFLNRGEGDPNYRIVTGYELGGEGVKPLDVAPAFDDYKGMDAATFLKAVRDAITRS